MYMYTSMCSLISECKFSTFTVWIYHKNIMFVMLSESYVVHTCTSRHYVFFLTKTSLYLCWILWHQTFLGIFLYVTINLTCASVLHCILNVLPNFTLLCIIWIKLSRLWLALHCLISNYIFCHFIIYLVLPLSFQRFPVLDMVYMRLLIFQ